MISGSTKMPLYYLYFFKYSLHAEFLAETMFQ